MDGEVIDNIAEAIDFCEECTEKFHWNGLKLTLIVCNDGIKRCVKCAITADGYGPLER